MIFLVSAMSGQMGGPVGQLVYDVSIAAGHAVICCAIIVVLLFAIWFVGGLLRTTALLQRLLYFVFLPAFLAPFIMSAEPYMWVNHAAWFEHRWLFLALTAVPGLLYLISARPVDHFGAPAGDNPWRANSLEWHTSSPPVHTNFESIPNVYRGPYEYSSPIVDEDFLPQNRNLEASQ